MLRLIFTTAPGSLVSRLIRWVSRSRASHVGIQLSETLVVSAEQRGVVQQSLDAFLVERKVVAIYEATPETVAMLDTENVRRQIGAPYEFVGGAGNMLALLVWRWFRRRIKNPLGNPHEFICSKLPLALDPERRLPEFRRIDPEETTPGVLLRHLACGHSFTRVDRASVRV